MAANNIEVQVFTPEGFDGPATTVVEALRRGRAVLDAEGRWLQGTWFKNLHPEVDPDDAFCNNWQVCAEGAVAIVTSGVGRYQFSGGKGNWDYDNALYSTGNDRQREIYQQALVFLTQAGRDLTGRINGAANWYNDVIFKSRQEVLVWFDRAIDLAEARANQVNELAQALAEADGGG